MAKGPRALQASAAPAPSASALEHMWNLGSQTPRARPASGPKGRHLWPEQWFRKRSTTHSVRPSVPADESLGSTDVPANRQGSLE